MAGFSIKVDDSAMKGQMSALVGNMADLTPAMKAFGEHMVKVTREERFGKERDPQGRKWAPLSPATYARSYGKPTHGRRGKMTAKFRRYVLARKILHESGHLQEVAYTADRQSMTIGTTPPSKDYAAIHQKGGKAGRGRKVTIPARPYLGFNSRDVAEAIATIKDHLGAGA